MNARQKAKRYKGGYRYNLTVCKAYRIQIKDLRFRMNVIANMGKQLSKESGYWQVLYQEKVSEDEYHEAVKTMVKNRREENK